MKRRGFFGSAVGLLCGGATAAQSSSTVTLSYPPNLDVSYYESTTPDGRKLVRLFINEIARDLHRNGAGMAGRVFERS